MTNEDKLREIFPKTIFLQLKENDKITALVCSDEWLNAEYQEPTPKNDLGVDAVSRADARSLICKIDIKHHLSGLSRKAFKDLYNGIDELPSVTPQLSSGLEKNSQKLEKNFGELDCISRADAIGSIAVECSAENLDIDYAKFLMLRRAIKALPTVTPIRPKGHWIETAEEYYKAINEKGGGVNEDTDYFVDDIACSECLAKFSVIDNETERFDFCPCCGSYNGGASNGNE